MGCKQSKELEPKLKRPPVATPPQNNIDRGNAVSSKEIGVQEHVLTVTTRPLPVTNQNFDPPPRLDPQKDLPGNRSKTVFERPTPPTNNEVKRTSPPRTRKETSRSKRAAKATGQTTGQRAWSSSNDPAESVKAHISYCGPIDKTEAHDLFKAVSQHGDYLIRDSIKDPGNFVLVMHEAGDIKKGIVQRKIAASNGKLIVKVGKQTIVVQNVEELLEKVQNCVRPALKIKKILQATSQSSTTSATTTTSTSISSSIPDNAVVNKEKNAAAAPPPPPRSTQTPVPPPVPPQVPPTPPPEEAQVFEEGLITEDMYNVDVNALMNQMNEHAFVKDVRDRVVLITGLDDDLQAPDEAKHLLDEFKKAGVKTWDYVGCLKPELAMLMPNILQNCFAIVIVNTDSLHGPQSQAGAFMAHALKVKDIGETLLAVKGTPDVNMHTGAFGMNWGNTEFYDLSKPGSKHYKQAFSTLTHKLKTKQKTLPKDAKLSPDNAPSIPDRANKFNNVLSPVSFDLSLLSDHSGKSELARGRILLLYSWGEPRDGVYKNQAKVQMVKNKLELAGFEVWMDIDYIDSDYNARNFAEVVALAIKNSWIVVACVSNSFHIPNSAANHAFIMALNCKKPGVDLFAIKLTPTAQMFPGSATVYGLYMGMQKYYDINCSDNTRVFKELVDDIRRMHPNGPTGEDGGEEDLYLQPMEEQIYGIADLAECKVTKQSSLGKPLPAIQASKGAIMLSYAWGSFVDGRFPNQEAMKALATLLQRQGFKCWIDIDHMMGNMDEVMAGVVTSSAAIIACVSPEYFKEQSNAQKEWAFGCQVKEFGKSLFVVEMSEGVSAQNLSVETCLANIRGQNVSLKKAKKDLHNNTYNLASAIEYAKRGDTIPSTSKVYEGLQQFYTKLEEAGIIAESNYISNTFKGVQEPNVEDIYGTTESGQKRTLPLPPLPTSAEELQESPYMSPSLLMQKRGPKMPIPPPRTRSPIQTANDDDIDDDNVIPSSIRNHPAFVHCHNTNAMKVIFTNESHDGDYLVRESNTHDGALVLILNVKGETRERKIAHSDNLFAIKKKGTSTLLTATSLTELLALVPELKRVARKSVRERVQAVHDYENDDEWQGEVKKVLSKKGKDVSTASLPILGNNDNKNHNNNTTTTTVTNTNGIAMYDNAENFDDAADVKTPVKKDDDDDDDDDDDVDDDDDDAHDYENDWLDDGDNAAPPTEPRGKLEELIASMEDQGDETSDDDDHDYENDNEELEL